MLLLLMTMPLLLLAVVVVEPKELMPLVGRFAPAGPILQLETVLLSLPVNATVSVLNTILPPAVPAVPPAIIAEPKTVALVTVLLVAPPMNRMVLVPATAETVVL